MNMVMMNQKHMLMKHRTKKQSMVIKKVLMVQKVMTRQSF